MIRSSLKEENMSCKRFNQRTKCKLGGVKSPANAAKICHEARKKSRDYHFPTKS